MARIRSIKPTFWTDEKIGLLPRAVRLTFLGLISAIADDQGRLVANSRIIRGAVYPYDDDISIVEVSEHVDALVKAHRVVRYTVNGDDYLYIRHWLKHQRVDKPSKSLLPEPPLDDEDLDSFEDDSTNDRRSFAPERSGAEAEWSGTEEERNGADADPIIRAEDRQPESAPLVELPVEANQLVERLYSLATAKRQLDVKRQLYDSLDPRLKGARLRRGVYVKARSREHLAECCRAVMDDPPRNIDASIIIVLEKLQDPPKGPTPSEIHKADTDKRVAQEEAYQRAAKASAVAWSKTHPDEYRVIRAAVDAEYADAGGSSFGRMARDAALTQKCNAAQGFPDFESWRGGQRGAA